jgi:hypothetical protein
LPTDFLLCAIHRKSLAMLESYYESNAARYCVSAISFLVLVLCIFRLRRRYAAEIYAVWYIFPLTFIIAVGLLVLRNYSVSYFGGGEGIRYAGQYWWINEAYQYLTDFEGELEIVSAVLVLALLPQYLTYLLGGLSGSASKPLFVSQITRVAIWSVIKFLAGCAGLFLGFCARLAASGYAPPVLLADGMINLAGSFFVMLVYLEGSAFLGDGKRSWLNVFRRIHNYCTRFRALDG